jgi:hypothetical protein
MKTKATFLKAERSTYEGRDGKPRVAHRLKVIMPDGEAGSFFLGGDTETGRALWGQVGNLGQGQQLELTFGVREYKGDLNIELRHVEAVKA